MVSGMGLAGSHRIVCLLCGCEGLGAVLPSLWRGGTFVCLSLRPVPVLRASCPYAHRAVSMQVCVDTDVSSHHRTEKFIAYSRDVFLLL